MNKRENKPSSFVRMFKPQFADMVEDGTKLQTVRPLPKRMPKPGDKLSLRAWIGKPYRSKQRILKEASVESVHLIEIRHPGETWDDLKIDNSPCSDTRKDKFAMADGFCNWDEMRQWFASTHGLPFKGIVICWARKEAAPLSELGNDLFQSIINHDYKDEKTAALQIKVWSPTPWVTNAYTGGENNNPEREHTIREWCTENFGPESWPIHDLPANWYRGGATINGWTWMGFKTQEMMEAFESEFPSPNDKAQRQLPEGNQ